MTQELFNKLNEAAIKADKLMEIKTGKRNLIINELNEMYKHGCSVDDMIGFLIEGKRSKEAGEFAADVAYNIKNPLDATRTVYDASKGWFNKTKGKLLNIAKKTTQKVAQASNDFKNSYNERNEENKEVAKQAKISKLKAELAELEGTPEPAPDGITRPIL